ncbi:MAG TPA: hypothetical protein VNH44_00115 [Micropepsaceae bacterium]|nr:hypothetical protein [Micropepsaceae bacterium]
MKRMELAGLALIAASLCSCTATKELTGTEDIKLAVTPATALCDAYQHDAVIGRSDPNTQTITVPQSRGATDILCFASGYKDKRITIVRDNPDLGAKLLTDFGPLELSAYPATIQIVMEPQDRPQRPR